MDFQRLDWNVEQRDQYASHLHKKPIKVFWEMIKPYVKSYLLDFKISDFFL